MPKAKIVITTGDEPEKAIREMIKIGLIKKVRINGGVVYGRYYMSPEKIRKAYRDKIAEEEIKATAKKHRKEVTRWR